MKAQVVVDTNIIFSALLPVQSPLRIILQDKSYNFVSPNFTISEVFKHKEKIFKYTLLSEPDFFNQLNNIIENIRFVPLDFISDENREKAFNFCKDTDLKDIPFVALSLELNAPLWTGDKKLKTGLKKLDFNNFFEEKIHNFTK